jgi:hypothetical protein
VVLLFGRIVRTTLEVHGRGDWKNIDRLQELCEEVESRIEEGE